LYDPASGGRYILIVDHETCTAPCSTSSKFYVAVTQTNNPLGLWWLYTITYGGPNDLGDFPTLGQDAQGIYTCFNAFSNADGSTYTGSKCFLLPKSAVYG